LFMQVQCLSAYEEKPKNAEKLRSQIYRKNVSITHNKRK